MQACTVHAPLQIGELGGRVVHLRDRAFLQRLLERVSAMVLRHELGCVGSIGTATRADVAPARREAAGKMAPEGGQADLGILGEEGLLHGGVVLGSVKLRVPKCPAPARPEFFVAAEDPLLGLTLGSFSLFDVGPAGGLAETPEAPAQLRLYRVELVLLRFRPWWALLGRGLDLDVIEDPLPAPSLAPVAIDLAGLVLEPLGLQGLLAVRLGDLLPESSRVPQGCRPKRVLVPPLRAFLRREARLHDLVELPQITVVLRLWGGLGRLFVCDGVFFRALSGVLAMLGALFEDPPGVRRQSSLARLSLEDVHLGGSLGGVDRCEGGALGHRLSGDLLRCLDGGERRRLQQAPRVRGMVILPLELGE